MMGYRYGKRKGFTIVELAVIVAVIGILATIGMVSYGAYTNRAADTQAEADLGQAAMQLEKHKANNGGYPAAQNEVDNGLPKSDNERTYEYFATTGSYCLSTTVDRTGKTFRIGSGSSRSVEGDCSEFVASELTLAAPVFNNAGSDGLMSYAYWSLPSGVPTSANIRISVACSGGGQITFERANSPSGVGVVGTSMYAWNADWNNAFSCSIGSSTIRVAYQKDGVWSSDLVITQAMITVD